MSYPRGSDAGPSGPGGGSIGSASLVATLATYVTSGSLATALTPYLTSASAALSTYITSGSLATALAAYATSNSVSIMIAAVALTSNSASAMIVTAIGDRPTSNSVSVMIAAAGGGGLTSNSASIMIVTALQVRQFGSASGATQAGTGAMNWSGSWTDFARFEINLGWRQLGNSGTLSVNIYTDGGTTPMLSIAALSTASATTNIAQLTIIGGGGAWYLWVQYLNNTNAMKVHATSTLNTGIVNCIRVGIANTTATASNISAYLTGFKRV